MLLKYKVPVEISSYKNEKWTDRKSKFKKYKKKKAEDRIFTQSNRFIMPKLNLFRHISAFLNCRVMAAGQKSPSDQPGREAAGKRQP
jgi:hypothetical protein